MKISRRLLPLLLALSALAHGEGIVTTLRPLTLIANAVTQGVETPRQLLPDGVSAHDYSLKASQRLALRQATLVVRVGEHHERFLAGILRDGDGVISLETLPGIRPLPLRGQDDLRPLPGTLDTHLWLQPANAILLANAIAEARARKNPARAADYRRNAQTFADALRQEEQAQKTRFATLPQRRYVAWHDAWQYLEAPLGLQAIGSVSLSPEQKPGARHLLDLRRRMNDMQARCLLTEPLADAGLIRQLAIPGLRTAAVDETFSGAPDYRSGWRRMADAVYACLR